MQSSNQTPDITFDEYLDLFWEVGDDEKLSVDEQEAKLEAELNARGISEDRQKQLAIEFMQSFNNPRPQE